MSKRTNSMRTKFVFSLIFLVVSLKSYCIDYHEKIRQYVIEIDSNHTNDFSTVVDKMLNDTTTYLLRKSQYTTIEYLVTNMLLSHNAMDCTRIRFIEYIISINRNNFKNKCTLGMLLFIEGDKTKLDDFMAKYNSDTLNESFLSSLSLALAIKKFKFGESFSVFQTQFDSLMDQYLDLPNSNENFRTMFPILELLSKWHDNFPHKFQKRASKFIFKKKEISASELISLKGYIGLMVSYTPECESKYNLDSRKYAFSLDGYSGLMDFKTEFEMDGYLNGMKKK